MNFFPRSTFPFLMLLLIFSGSACLARQNPADDQEQTGPTRATVIPDDDDQVVPTPQLPDLGPAPELENEIWLNTAQPLRLADLRGQVVLLEMWTFG